MGLTTWKPLVQTKMEEIGSWLNQPAKTPMVYGTLCGLSLWTFVEQMTRTGDPVAAVGGLYSAVNNLDSNLLAAQVYSWHSQRQKGQTVPTQAEVMSWANQQAATNPQAQAEFDQLMLQLDTMRVAKPYLEPHWQQQLLTELNRLGNLPRFEAPLTGVGIVVQGQGHQFHGPVTVIGEQHIHEADPTGPDPVSLARTRYLRYLINQCNAIPLAALGGEESLGEEVGLEQVYIELNTTTLAGDGQGGWDADRERPLSALEAATRYKRLVLLGDPGSGKSSFVRRLAAWLAAAYLGERQPPTGWPRLLPLFTTMRDLAPRLARLKLNQEMGENEIMRRLKGAIWEQWQADLHECRADAYADALNDDLLSGQVILILDGLDELPEQMRSRVRWVVQAVLRAYPKLQQSHILITCRIRSWQGELFPGFTTQTLAPLTPDQINQFVRSWYQAQVALERLTTAEANKRVVDLQAAATSPDLLKLAESPMLLTTMALIHQQHVGLPKERVRLYNRAVQILLGHWQKRKGLNTSPALSQWLTDERQLRAALDRLAYEAHQRQAQLQKSGVSDKSGLSGAEQPADLTRGEILTLLEKPQYLNDASLAAEFLDYVDQRAGLLVGRGGEGNGKPSVYTFPHRTFQEYLAGCYLVTGRRMNRNINPLAEAGDYWAVAVQLGTEELLYNNRQAAELFFDLAYSLCPTDSPRSPADWRRTLWSGIMATQIGEAEIRADEVGNGSRYLVRLTPRLTQVVNGTPPVLPAIERAEAADALAAFNEPERPEIIDVDAMNFCLVPAGPFWMGSDEDNPIKKKVERPLHLNETVNRPYWLARFPVTNAQFQQFVAAGGYKIARYWLEAEIADRWRDGRVKAWSDEEWRGHPYDFGLPMNLGNHPVVGIMWYEALAFCRWLTERWQAQGWLPEGYTAQLPSEAEWEKGARGGLLLPEKPTIQAIQALATVELTVNSDAVFNPQQLILNPAPRRRYPWGDDSFDAEHLNAEVTQLGGTSGVGCFPMGQSGYGAEEMVGNVWEWTRSLWEFAYPYQNNNRREQLEAGDSMARSLRGGAYSEGCDWARCSFRFGYFPGDGNGSVGFRVVLSG